jgi:hypothetical protein
MMSLVRATGLQLSLVLSLPLLATPACDDVTPQSYVELVESSRECSADTDCVLAGEGGCTCASPINMSAQEEVTEAAAELDCENVTTTMCPAHDNLRCEADRCVTDGSP